MSIRVKSPLKNATPASPTIITDSKYRTTPQINKI